MKIQWGDDGYKSKKSVEEAIEDFCINELDNAKLGDVEIDGKIYVIRITATLEKFVHTWPSPRNRT